MKKNDELISVIMPVYNGMPHIDLAIKSILDQSYKNFEFLIIDDGSTDDSANLIHHYATKDNRIKFKSRQNMGLIYTLNELIDTSSGDYIARMDADDISATDRFLKQITLMKSQNIEICGTAYHTINYDNEFLKSYSVFESHEEVSLKMIFEVPFCHGSIMLKKNLLKLYKYDDINFKSIEDYVLWTKLMEAGIKFGNLNEDLYALRVHDLSFSMTKKRKMRDESQKLKKRYVSENLQLLEKSLLQISKNLTKQNYTLAVAACFILKKLPRTIYKNIEKIKLKEFIKYLIT
jgi:glycosyltransferase involved in cell wall biosynthesis